MADRYYGVYGALVDANDAGEGVLSVTIPAVFPAGEVVQARPCLPYGVLFLPEKNDKVWVEFEGGEPTLPVWTGVQYGPGDWAAEAAKNPPTIRAIKTAAGHLLTFDDTGGSEAIVITDGASQHAVRLDSNGITIEHGQAGHTITLASDKISVTHGGGQNAVTVEAATITAKTATATIELGPAGVSISGTPLIKLSSAQAPVARAGPTGDMGIGNLGAPVIITPGQFTVLA